MAEVKSRRKLHSASTAAMIVPATLRSTISDRAFSIAAARTWNGLLLSVTSWLSLPVFRINLKTVVQRVLHNLLECALCAQLPPGHVYLVAHTMVTVFAVLPLPVLVCGTVCCCTFKNRKFHSTVLKLCCGRFCFR